MKQKIYIFSGLGADARVFKHVDFGENEVVFLDWLLPDKTESIENYARRMARFIDAEDPILMGISFGGIMAIEVSQVLPTKKLVLLATAKNRSELPALYRFFGRIQALRIFPVALMKRTHFLTYYLFGVKEKEHQRILSDIFRQTDTRFLKWALIQILQWKRTEKPVNAIHIHGTKDHIIPCKQEMQAKEIQGGGHLITLSHPKELNDLLTHEWKNINA